MPHLREGLATLLYCNCPTSKTNLDQYLVNEFINFKKWINTFPDKEYIQYRDIVCRGVLLKL